jgi:hypothetical protein
MQYHSNRSARPKFNCAFAAVTKLVDEICETLPKAAGHLYRHLLMDRPFGLPFEFQITDFKASINSREKPYCPYWIKQCFTKLCNLNLITVIKDYGRGCYKLVTNHPNFSLKNDNETLKTPNESSKKPPSNPDAAVDLLYNNRESQTPTTHPVCDFKICKEEELILRNEITNELDQLKINSQIYQEKSQDKKIDCEDQNIPATSLDNDKDIQGLEQYKEFLQDYHKNAPDKDQLIAQDLVAAASINFSADLPDQPGIDLEIKKIELEPLLDEADGLGVKMHPQMLKFICQFSVREISQALKILRGSSPRNPTGFLRKALTDCWVTGKNDDRRNDDYKIKEEIPEPTDDELAQLKQLKADCQIKDFYQQSTGLGDGSKIWVVDHNKGTCYWNKFLKTD